MFGAVANAILLVTGQDYSTMADGALVDYVRDKWHSVFAPNTAAFISILIVFELSTGILIRLGGRRAVLGLGGTTIGFHIGLMMLGWGFWAWSVPMQGILGWLMAGSIREARKSSDAERHLRIAA